MPRPLTAAISLTAQRNEARERQRDLDEAAGMALNEARLSGGVVPPSGVAPGGTGFRRINAGVEQGTASFPTKAEVGLGSADNTSDANKPVSTAQAAVNALKGNIDAQTWTGIHNFTGIPRFTTAGDAANYLFDITTSSALAPRLRLGTIATPGQYFEIGAWDGINNFDTKGRNLKFFGTGGYTFLDAGTGMFGVGVSPLAALHLKAGTAAANTAPIRLTSGPLNTTPVGGQIEYDNAWWMTNSAGTRETIGSNARANHTGTQSHTTVNVDALGYTGAVTRTQKSKNQDVVSVRDFGAIGDGTTDDTVAVQAAVDYIRTLYSAVTGDFRAILDFAGRSYKVTASINLTLLRQPGLTLQNGGLAGYCTGKVVLDMSGSNTITLQNFFVYGDKTSTPAVGILIGRALFGGGYPAAPNMKWVRVETNGFFSKSAVINYASEVSGLTTCQFINRSRSLTAYSYISCGHYQTLADYVGGLTSDFCTIPLAAVGTLSNICHWLDQVHIQRASDVVLAATGITKANPAVVSVASAALTAAAMANGDKVFFSNVVGMTQLNGNSYTVANLNNAGGTFELSGINSTAYGVFTSGTVWNQTGPAMLLNGSGLMTGRSGYLLTYGAPGIVVDLVNGSPIRMLDMEYQPEAEQPVGIQLDSGAVNKVIQGVRLVLLAAAQNFSSCVINNTGTGTIQFQGFDLRITNMAAAPAFGIFKTPSLISVREGKIAVPLNAALNTAASYIAYVGWMVAQDVTPPMTQYSTTQLASTISDFAATVRATILTGLSTASSAVIAATDTILAALGQLQAQVTLRAIDTAVVHNTGAETVAGAKTWSSAAVFNSNITTDGGYVLVNRVGDATSSQNYQDTDAGFASQNIYRVGGLLRWQTLRTSAAESGANAGSNWQFAAYDDAGASLGNVYTVVRATQVLSFAVNPIVLTAAAGTNTTAAASTAYAMSAAPNASYRTLMTCAGSHTAAKVAGTYAMGQGDPLAVSGTGTLYPIQTIYIAAADFPTVNSLTTKLRIRAQLHTNDVAPTGNFTFGLYPVTRPAVSGAAGLCIYTLGTVVSGSNGATFTAPAADGPPTPFAVGADFAIPADGLYCIGVVTTAIVAASSHLHLTATLQMRNA